MNMYIKIRRDRTLVNSTPRNEGEKSPGIKGDFSVARPLSCFAPSFSRSFEMTGVRWVFLAILFLSPIIVQTGCKKAIEVAAPYTSLNAANVYTNDATAASVLTNLYANMSNNNINASDIPGLFLYASLGADELTLYGGTSGAILDYYSNNLTINTNVNFWGSIYKQIFITNNAIEGLNGSTGGLTPAIKQQLLGEAKFMRAFYYFYLANMYGAVPLVLSTDYKTTSLLAKTPTMQVYEQVVADLKAAQSLLSVNYLKGDALTGYTTGLEDRVRPNQWAATALLARTYLYTGKYDSAEAQASAVINNTVLYNLPSLDSSFLKNNKGAIWALQPVNNSNRSNTGEGYTFVLPAAGPNTGINPAYLSNTVWNAFEVGDLRKTKWVNSVTAGTPAVTYLYPNKYKVGNVANPSNTVSEYSILFRIAEQLLIRAEARALKASSDIAGAQADLNAVRSKAGLSNTTATTQSTLLTAIMHERQVELFTEYGHRWFDLKRTGTIDAVMGAPGNATTAKGGTWNTNQQLYPIPLTELVADPNLVQNAGY